MSARGIPSSPSCGNGRTKMVITRKERLASHPLCYHCKYRPHTPGNWWCTECRRERRHGPKKWHSRRTGLEWCKVCGSNPRLPYHHYCAKCKIDYQNRTRLKKWRERHPDWQSREHANARAYATGLLARGKIKRGQCAYCDKPGTEFHHYDYHRRTRNFEDVCYCCHVKVHRVLKIMFALFSNGAYLFDRCQ